MAKPKSKSVAKRKATATDGGAEVVAQVKTWIVEGETQHEIEKAIGEQFPHVDRAKAIAAAALSLVEDANPDAAIVRGWSFNALREIFRRALAAGEFTAAIKAIHEMRAIADAGGDPGSQLDDGADAGAQ